MITTEDEMVKVQHFVQDLQRRGYSKYASTQEVQTEFELSWQRAYYRVRKFWNPPTHHSRKKDPQNA